MSYQVGLRLAKLDRSLPNIASGEMFFRKLIQDDATPPGSQAPWGRSCPILRFGIVAREGLSLRSLLRGPAPRSGRSMLAKRGRSMGHDLYRRMLEYTVRTFQASSSRWCDVGVSALSGSTAFLVKPILDDIFIRKDAAQLTYIPLLVCRSTFSAASWSSPELPDGRVGQRVVRGHPGAPVSPPAVAVAIVLPAAPTGVLMSRVLNDVGLMQSAITDAATGLVKDIFTAAFLVFVIFYRDWKLALVALVVFPLAFWPIARFGRKLRRTSVKAQEITGGLSSTCRRRSAGEAGEVVRAETYEVERFSTRTTSCSD